MLQQKIITVIAKDHNGLLADVAEILSKASINLISIKASAYHLEAVLHLEIDLKEIDEALRLLTQAGFHAMSDEMIAMSLDDEPGSLAKIARMLSNEGVSVRGITTLWRQNGKAIVVISTNENIKARTLLANYLV
jgi:hypothetical protein